MTWYRSLSEIVKETREWSISDHPRIPIGYPILDSLTGGGAAAGEVILFQARSSVGKTTLAQNVIENNAGRVIVFFSLEMHARYIALRSSAIHNGLGTQQIEDMLRAGETWPLARLVETQPNLVVIDKPAMSLKEMGQAMHEVTAKLGQPVDLVVMDYMELIGGTPGFSDLGKVDTIARKVKDFTREHDTVTLLLHQVGRDAGGSGDQPLGLAAGRYGGETQADYVLGAYRPCLRPGISEDQYMKERDQFFLQFLKSRGGGQIHPSGMLHHLDPVTMRLSYPYPSTPLFS